MLPPMDFEFDNRVEKGKTGLWAENWGVCGTLSAL